jgi:pimeloyl-ACP methyl ester carboxylesterase
MDLLPGDLLPGVRASIVETDRLTMHVIEAGPPDGIPVLLLHGNLSTGRYYESLMAAAPDRYRLIAPDLRGFGRTEARPIDATRGIRDWSDDAHALASALGLPADVHVAGWSTGGAAAACYVIDHGAASLTLIDPVSPYGFGGCHRDGAPCFEDWAGTGGGTANPDFTARLAAGDRSTESPFSPRNVLNSSYWAPTHHEPPEREEALLDELLLTPIGPAGYPGDVAPSDNWPGFGPGTTGLLNALSGRYLNWSGIVDVDPKPPVLWTHGTADIVIADASGWEMGTLGQMGLVPGWPGAEVYPPQLMVTQIDDVLARYREGGGRVDVEKYEGSGHFPVIDAADTWRTVFFTFLDSVA